MKLGAKLGLLVDFVLGAFNWKPDMEHTLRTLDTVVQLNARGVVNAPPSSNDGDTFIVGSAATGAFLGEAAGTVARYHAPAAGATFSGWEFNNPQQGWLAHIAGTGYMYFDGASWQLLSASMASTINAAASSALGAHLGAADPHSQYVKKSGDTMTGSLHSNADVTWGTTSGREVLNSLSDAAHSGSYYATSTLANLPPFGASYIQHIAYPAAQNYWAQLAISAFAGRAAIRTNHTGTAAQPAWTELETVKPAQTWQDVTASRAIGVVYTNTTDRPIHIDVRVQFGANSSAGFLVDGVLHGVDGNSSASPTVTCLTCVVPAGSTVELNTFSNTAWILQWKELR